MTGMDISLYFNPVDFDLFMQGERFSKYSLGYFIRKDTLKASWTKKGGIKVAILGVPYESGTSNTGTAKAPDEIRKQLYGMSNLEGLRGVIDLGNLKPGKTSRDIHFALRDVVEYLNDSGIIAVVLGGGQDISIGIARAFRDVRDFTLSVVDSRVDVKTGRQVTGSSNFISRILNETPQIYHLEIIGIQSHLVSPDILEQLKELTFDYVQLGRLRDDFTMVEPLLRNTTFLSFDISSVRQADAKRHFQPSANGFHGEEACRIAHYAGLSNKMKVFGLFEVNPDDDPEKMTADLTAQMVWYFLEARSHRLDADPTTDKSAFVKYYVEMEGHPMVFYLHGPTGRWWIEIETGENESVIVPCRESDYASAMKREFPDVWWKFARKTDRLSK